MIPRTKSLLLAAIAVALIGVSLLAAKALNTAAYDWTPLEVPLSRTPDVRVSASFVAEVDAVYDVALEYSSVLPEATFDALLKAAGDAAAADVSWSVESNGEFAAKGGSRIHLYYSTGGRTLLGKIRRYLLSVPFHRDQASFVQVIGRFPSRAGQTYDVSVTQHALEPSLWETAPRLSLRLSREFWTQHSQGMLTFAYAGLALVALSAVLLLLGIGRALVGKRQAP